MAVGGGFLGMEVSYAHLMGMNTHEGTLLHEEFMMLPTMTSALSYISSASANTAP